MTSRWWCTLHRVYDCDCHAPKTEHDAGGVEVTSWDTDASPPIELVPCAVCGSTEPAHSQALCDAIAELADFETTVTKLVDVLRDAHRGDHTHVGSRDAACAACLADRLLGMLGKL